MEGVNVTKYKTIATSTDGKKFGGSPGTKEGIPLKVDLLYKQGEEKHRMTTELHNLKIGPQDPQLFELPADYTKFDMAGMMGERNGLQCQKSQGTEARQILPNPESPASAPDDKSDVDEAKT